MERIVKTVVVAWALVLLTVPAIAASPSEPSFQNLHIEGIVKPEDIKKTADFVVESADRVNAVFTSYTSKVDGMLNEMTAVSNDVAQAVNTWMSNPSDENKTHLREVVTDGGIRIKAVAAALASESPKVTEVLQLARTNIKSKVDETSRTASQIGSTLASLAKQRESLMAKLKDTYQRLSASAEGETPAEMAPEAQEELAKLKTDWVELNFIADQWAGKEARMRMFSDTMSRATSRFNSVERMVRLTGYQANSFARMAGTIGAQGADEIPLEMWEGTFGQLTELENAITDNFKRFEQVSFGLGDVRDAGNAVWAKQSGSGPATEATPKADGTPLLAWLKETVEGNAQKVAQLPQKQQDKESAQ